MIFNKEKQRCLFSPPKNGTFSAFEFLKELQWYSHPHWHYTTMHSCPDAMLEKYPNLKNYELYVFVRNPVERFVSAILHVKRIYVDNCIQIIREKNLDTSVKDMSYDMFIDHIDTFKSVYPLVFQPQIKWLSVPSINILDFYNFESELRRISEAYDVEKYPVPVRNKSTSFGRSVITEKVMQFVEREYADDCRIWREHFGRRVAA